MDCHVPRQRRKNPARSIPLNQLPQISSGCTGARDKTHRSRMKLSIVRWHPIPSAGYKWCVPAPSTPNEVDEGDEEPWLGDRVTVGGDNRGREGTVIDILLADAGDELSYTVRVDSGTIETVPTGSI